MTIEEKNFDRLFRMYEERCAEIERLRAALSQFVAVCDTAPPTSLITEIGIACSAARSALASDQ